MPAYSRCSFSVAFDPLFHLAHGEQILVHLTPVGAAQRRLEASAYRRAPGRECSCARPCRRARTFGREVVIVGAEQPLEYHARIGFRRQRRRRGSARRACSDRRSCNRNRRRRPCACRRSRARAKRSAFALLVTSPRSDRRNAALNIGAAGLLAVHAGEIRGAGAGVVARAVAERFGLVMIEPGEHARSRSRNASSGFRMREN